MKITHMEQIRPGHLYRNRSYDFVVQLITRMEIHIYDRERQVVRRISRAELTHDISAGRITRQ